jgi:hypothetical protein
MNAAPLTNGAAYQFFILIATSYFDTDVRVPGVFPAGMALRISSPFL